MLCLDASLVLLTWPALAAALVLNTTSNENEHVISQDLAMSSSTGILDSRSLASTPASVYDVTYWELRRVQETVARSETNDTEWQWSVVTELTASSVTSGNCSFPDTTGTGSVYASCCSQILRDFALQSRTDAAAYLHAGSGSWSTYTTVERVRDKTKPFGCSNVWYSNTSPYLPTPTTRTVSFPVVESEGIVTSKACSVSLDDCGPAITSYWSAHDDFYYRQSTDWAHVNRTAAALLYFPDDCIMNIDLGRYYWASELPEPQCTETCTLDAENVDLYYLVPPSTAQDMCALPPLPNVGGALMPNGDANITYTNTLNNGSTAIMRGDLVYLDFHRPRIILPPGCLSGANGWDSAISYYPHDIFMTVQSSAVSHRIESYPWPRRLNFGDVAAAKYALSARGREWTWFTSPWGKATFSDWSSHHFNLEVPDLAKVFPWPQTCLKRVQPRYGIFDPPKGFSPTTMENLIAPTFAASPGASFEYPATRTSSGPITIDDPTPAPSSTSLFTPADRPIPTLFGPYAVGADTIAKQDSVVTIFSKGILTPGAYTRKPDGLAIRFGTDNQITIFGLTPGSSSQFAVPDDKRRPVMITIDGYPIYSLDHNGYVQVGGDLNIILAPGETISLAGTIIQNRGSELRIGGPSPSTLSLGPRRVLTIAGKDSSIGLLTLGVGEARIGSMILSQGGSTRGTYDGHSYALSSNVLVVDGTATHTLPSAWSRDEMDDQDAYTTSPGGIATQSSEVSHTRTTKKNLGVKTISRLSQKQLIWLYAIFSWLRL